jgi:DNA mismatch repair protein MutS
MLIDSATLADLEILSPSTKSGPTLWELIDRTRTRVGRDMLRRRLTAPLNSAGELLLLQRAHQALAAEANTYRAALDLADTDGAEHFLGSNWQLPAEMAGRRRVSGLWQGKWYRQYLQEVENGQVRVASLFVAAASLSRHLATSEATALRDLGAQIGALTTVPAVQQLRRLAALRSRAARLEFDQLARGDAKPRLRDLLDHLGTIEAMWSLAVATVEHRWSYPIPGSEFRVAGLVHPFLAVAAVPNDLELDDATRVCYITGPNMAGKSTFLKAIAIAVLLAHLGCGVPATSMELPIVATVFSSVQIADNLSAGESFYLAEVRRIRALAQALRNHGSIVAVIDEPFRGTNVHDAADATLAILTRLAAQPRALTLIASHITEVVPAIVEDPRIRLLYFAADATTEQPRFDYRLRAGVSEQRLGMTLLQQEQVLELLEFPAQDRVSSDK